VGSRTDLGAGVAFNAEIRARFPGLRTEFIATQDPGVNYARLKAAADSADVVVISSYVGQIWDAVSISAPAGFTSLVNGLLERGNAPIVVTFGNPYLLLQIPRTAAYLVAWGGSPVSQIAAAKALVGDAPISGHLPISIPPYLRRGAGIETPIRAH